MIHAVTDLSEKAHTHLSTLHLFTLGYQLIPASDFLQELTSASIHVVIDVRETAWSRKPGFSASQLREALGSAGIEYVHAPFAGNPKELRANLSDHQECLHRYGDHLESNPQILDEMTELLLTLPEASRICFICYERHPDDCHRAILLAGWQNAFQLELPVQHLSPHGAPRFLKG